MSGDIDHLVDVIDRLRADLAAAEARYLDLHARLTDADLRAERAYAGAAALRSALERVVAADDDPPNYSMHADACRRQPGTCTCHMALAHAALAAAAASNKRGD